MAFRFALASEFPHRCNKDGTIDSICPRCFATIGTSTWEADLEKMEAAHMCSPEQLSYLRREPRKDPQGIDNWGSPGNTAAVA